jgi:hypothetical protein
MTFLIKVAASKESNFIAHDWPIVKLTAALTKFNNTIQQPVKNHSNCRCQNENTDFYFYGIIK